MASNNKKNYYSILKVSSLASEQTIKNAYQRLAKVHHPDKSPNNPESEKIFRQIVEAYQTLSDPFKRKSYDKKLKKEKEKKPQPKKPMYDTFDTYQNLSHTRERAHFTDSFSTRERGFTAPPGQAFNLELSLEEVEKGCRKQISWPSGPKAHKHTHVISIPPGVENNQKLPLHNIPSSPAFPPGSYALIQYKPHPIFKKEGLNLLLDLTIPFTTAILGGKIKVPTLFSTVQFSLPSFTHHKHIIRLKNQGFSSSLKKKGDMLITIGIDIPKKLSSKDLLWIKDLHKKELLCPKALESEKNIQNFLKSRTK